MMAYINREDLLATINEVWERKYARCDYKLLYDVYRMVIRRINRAHEEDVEPVRHGQWISTNIPSYFGGVIYKCSLCGAKEGDHSNILGTYCWRCGAKMNGGDNNEQIYYN